MRPGNALGHPDTPEAPSGPSSSRARPITHINGYGVCGRCGAEWTGYNTCHCAGCHRTFTGITAFDQHRSGSHAWGQRHCLDPATVGLVAVTKRYWSGWGSPESDNRFFADESEASGT
jgi:hypothetical protein